MSALAQTRPPQQFSASSEASALTVELAKMLILVAPITMTAEQQELWLRAAVDALEGIRASELRDVSAELRRKVTRPNQIVPEIARLVAERRSLPPRANDDGKLSETDIEREAQERRAKAHGRDQVEAAWRWERNARIENGLHVPLIAKPLSCDELDHLSLETRSLGLKYGFLAYRDGKLVEA